MQLSFDIQSRTDFIAFGTAMAFFVAAGNRGRAFMFSCGGDDRSGKSFLALCVDRILDPSRYPDGLPATLSADYMLRPFYAAHLKRPARTNRLKTVFQNFSYHPQFFPDFDKSLAKLREIYAHALVIAVSNPQRDRQGFDYAANGLASSQLDLHIHFEILPGSFARRLTFTFDNPALVPLLQPFLPAMPGRPRLATSCIYQPA